MERGALGGGSELPCLGQAAELICCSVGKNRWLGPRGDSQVRLERAVRAARMAFSLLWGWAEFWTEAR